MKSTAPALPLLLLLLLTVSTLSDHPNPLPLPLGSQISASTALKWLSPTGAFSLGFLPSTDDPNLGLTVAIYHSIPPQPTPVWTVGAGVRVSDRAVLKLSTDGSLDLFDARPDGLPVWSSNTAGGGVRAAALTDAGNLVLLGFGGGVVWQSFDCPTDTLLPGQALKYPQSLQAASGGTVASYYKLTVISSGGVSLVWENNVTYWASVISFAVAGTELRLQGNGLLGLFGRDGGLAWFRLSADFRDPAVELRRLTIDVDGNLRMYSWDNASLVWRVGWQAVQNQCEVFASCGLYSVCSYNSTGPVCHCLFDDSGLGPHKCEKMPDLGSCSTGTTMSILDKTVLYSLYPPHDVDMLLSNEGCNNYCLNDSSCFAATARNDGSGVCTIKRTRFISGYKHSSVQAVSFLKECMVPVAVSAQAANVHGNGGMPLQPMDGIVGGHKNMKAGVAVLLLVTAFVFLAAEMFVFWFVVYRRRRISARRRNQFGKDVQMNPHYSAVMRLSLDEVRELTKNFASKLGPTVYKGMLSNKLPITVKVLKNLEASDKDFQMAVSTLGSTHHRNLVTLKGFCCEGNQKILLYEYISNGSLDQWLFGKRQSRSKDSWHQRLSIAIGTARALTYLHLECKQCIPHGNLKLGNILLDENLVVKVTGFGLRSLVEKNVASSSETPPERDVYMLGGILLHIVSGKRINIESELCELAYHALEKGELDDFVDINLEGESEREAMQRLIRLALWCMQPQPTVRPSIGEVVMVLEGTLSLDMPPSLMQAH